MLPVAAERMVTIWRRAAVTPRPVCEPQYWDDERRSARAAATPRPARAAPSRDTQHSQRKNDRR
jgi:hypothetical protein